MLSPYYHFLFCYGYVHNDWVMIRVFKSKISCLNCVDGKIIRNDKSINHVILVDHCRCRQVDDPESGRTVWSCRLQKSDCRQIHRHQ